MAVAVLAGDSILSKSLQFPDLVDATGGHNVEYTGNFLARELRNICNNTKGLFPKSAKHRQEYYAENGKPLRYLSHYETDFNGRFWGKEHYRDLPRAKKEAESWPKIGDHTQKKKESKKKRRKPKMFMNWKIPERVVSNDGSARGSTRGSRDSKASCTSVRSKQSERQEQLPKIPDVPCPPSPRKAPTPKKSATPRLPTKKTPCKPTEVSRSEVIKQTLNPQLQRKAEQLLENAAPCERRAIEKALYAAQRAGKQGPGQPKKNYKPDVKAAVNQWLDDATDDERHLAMEFFHSMSGGRMIAGPSHEKQKRLHQVLSQLETGTAHGVSKSQPCLPTKDKKGLKTIQLYPPGDRKNRWMHTTWHHMPDYRDVDPVNNRSAIYVDSQRAIPRHYTIHPDWGI